MSISDKPKSSEHPDSALLEYLEDLLSPQDRAVLEEHVNECQDCAQDLQDLDLVTSILRTEKQAFCPEPWQLFEYAESGTDSSGRVAEHVGKCPQCRQDYELYKSGCAQEVAMPENVRHAVRSHFTRPVEESTHRHRRALDSLLSRVSLFFRVPAMALGTAAAAILLVILVYPRGDIEPLMGLSSVSWDRTAAIPADMDLAGKSKEEVDRLLRGIGKQNGLQKGVVGPSGSAEEKRPKVAVVIFLKGFSDPWPQSKVDALYNALTPTEQIRERLEILSPSVVKEAVDRLGIKPSDRRELVSKLHSDLGASRVLALEIVAEGDKLGVEDEMIDAGTGRTLAKTTIHSVTDADLPSKLGDSAMPLLEAKGLAD